MREQITPFEGKILDGVNHYRACLQIGIDPLPKDYEGTDALGFVISMNLRRRHLNETQRAMVAAKIATMPQGARTDLSPIGERSQENAAGLSNVGKRSVERAAKVLDHGTPELVDMVEWGEVSVSAAAEVADLPEAEQRALVNNGKKVVAQAAKAARGRRMPMPGSPMEPSPPRQEGQPNFAPGDVLVELDKAERLLDNIDVRGCELGFRQPQLTTGIETCQRVRSCVDKIEAEFKAFLDNERPMRATDLRYALTTKQRR